MTIGERAREIEKLVTMIIEERETIGSILGVLSVSLVGVGIVTGLIYAIVWWCAGPKMKKRMRDSRDQLTPFL